MRQVLLLGVLGARPAQVVRGVTGGLLGLVCLGLAAGLAGGIACQRFVESLLFEVKATDPGMLAAPLVALFAAAVLAGLPPRFEPCGSIPPKRCETSDRYARMSFTTWPATSVNR